MSDDSGEQVHRLRGEQGERVTPQAAVVGELLLCPQDACREFEGRYSECDSGGRCVADARRPSGAFDRVGGDEDSVGCAEA